MFVIIDDRFSAEGMMDIERYIIGLYVDEFFRPNMDEYGKTVTITTKNGTFFMKDDEASAFRTTDHIELIRSLESDMCETCLYMNRLLIFSEDIDGILSEHSENDVDVSVFVKDIPGHSGMVNVYLDKDMRLEYDPKNQLIRTKLLDLNCYVVEKELIVRELKKRGSLDDFSIQELSRNKELRIMGIKLRSRVGVIVDHFTLLEAQRVLMDSSQPYIERKTIMNHELRSDMHLSYPVYIGKNVSVGRNCRLGPYVSIHEGTRIGENVHIINSFIGEKCTIGDNCYLEGMILPPDSTVSSDTSLEWSLLGPSDRPFPLEKL